MCGLLSVIHRDGSNVDRSLVLRMRDVLVHRGPDDAGLYIENQVALAHRRLSIIDLSDLGKQPMTNEDQSVYLVFNGEIYNYLEIMKELKKKGHIFNSSTDSEVIIHLYEEGGVSCLDSLNGMFSFVLWDKRRNKIFAARDRMGIKPLYYFYDHKKIIFSSEIKAIIEDPHVERKPNKQALSDYFFSGVALEGKTVFESIREVEAGTSVEFDLTANKLKVNRYWDIDYNYDYNRSNNDVYEELLSLLADSVRVHCRSDAALGSHLSGGLDTSTIVALASKHRQGLPTFSIKFSDDSFIDETSYAKSVAGHVGATYYEGNPTSEDFSRLLPFLIWHMDMPMATGGGFSYFTVSRLARKHVKVALTGHGGDELFAGYPAQFRAAYGNTLMFSSQKHKDPYKNIGFSLKEKLSLTPLNKCLPLLMKKVLCRLDKGEKSLEDLWAELHCRNVNNNSIFTEKFIRELGEYNSFDDYVKPLQRAGTDSALDRVLYHDQRVYLPGLLHLEDRASMSMSIESRVPFLDFRILEFLATVPPEQKITGMQPKHLMREVASRLLPEKVWKRKDKQPFPVPGKFWMSKDMKKMVREILLSEESLQRGIFKPRALQYLCEKDINVAWPIVNVELWHKIFIDNNKSWLDRARSIQ